MLNDEIITKLAEETVESFGDLDDNFKSELLDTAKKTIEAEYRKRVLKDLNKVAISKLDYYLSYSVEDENYRNTVLEFLRAGCVLIENNSVGEVYLAYSVFCRENNLHALSKISFSKEIQKHTGLSSKTTTINGCSVRLFIRS